MSYKTGALEAPDSCRGALALFHSSGFSGVFPGIFPVKAAAGGGGGEVICSSISSVVRCVLSAALCGVCFN